MDSVYLFQLVKQFIKLFTLFTGYERNQLKQYSSSEEPQINFWFIHQATLGAWYAMRWEVN